jgi:hypothetical protein
MHDYLTMDIGSYQLYSNKMEYCCLVALSSLYEIYICLCISCVVNLHIAKLYWDKQINYFLKVPFFRNIKKNYDDEGTKFQISIAHPCGIEIRC